MRTRPKHRPTTGRERDALKRATDAWGPVMLYRVTGAGLDKKNVDVRKENFAWLASMDVHDYPGDPDGRTSTTRPILLIGSDGASTASQVRWYRVNNPRKDPRFRISGLVSMAQPGNLIAVGMSEGVIVVCTLSTMASDWADDGGEAPETWPADAHEGSLVWRLHKHKARERDPSLVRARKDAARQEHDCLECEACGLGPEKAYAADAGRAIEAHHLEPLANLPSDGGATSLADQALLCATCHRLVHALEISVADVKELRAKASSA